MEGIRLLLLLLLLLLHLLRGGVSRQRKIPSEYEYLITQINRISTVTQIIKNKR
jgi:hypothetical protein